MLLGGSALVVDAHDVVGSRPAAATGSAPALAGADAATADAARLDVAAAVTERLAMVAAARSSRSRGATAPVLSGARVRPAAGAITGPFGERRSGHRHPGTDFDGSTGDPVYAAADGYVTLVGRAPAGFSGYGTIVLIVHPGGVQTLYAHLSRTMVTPGQAVAAGQRIGSIGTSGHVTGSHLHFEVHIDGHRVDPAAWLRGG